MYQFSVFCQVAQHCSKHMCILFFGKVRVVKHTHRTHHNQSTPATHLKDVTHTLTQSLPPPPPHTHIHSQAHTYTRTYTMSVLFKKFNQQHRERKQTRIETTDQHNTEK
jgi:hypothetical protein